MKSTTPQRLDPKFEQTLKKIAVIRVTKGLAKLNQQETSFREMTMLLQRTKGWELSLEELKVKPKKKQ